MDETKSASTMGVIPWMAPQQWQEAQLGIATIVKALKNQAAAVDSFLGVIKDSFSELEEIAQELCELTCASCDSVCCVKATVWYDQRDLLYLVLATGKFPTQQINKNSGVCSHLQADGCCLKRHQRPFICTWYVCTTQKELLAQAPEKKERLNQSIMKIQQARKELETLAVQVTSA